MQVPFGKYRGRGVDILVRDESYCHWLLDQSWLEESYPDLAALVIEHHPPSRWSPNYDRGWCDGRDAVWRLVQRTCMPELFIEVRRRVYGCTCDAPLAVCDCGYGHLTGGHADDCNISTERQQLRQRKAQLQNGRHRCSGVRADGEPCRQFVGTEGAYCRHHQPEDVAEQIASDFQRFLSSGD